QKVLDIGCGWGSLAIDIAKTANCNVTGITLSENQFNYCNKKAKKFNLENKIAFKLIDYRQLNEKFDRIVSVGMFEHVGRKFYKKFFKQLDKLLTDDGISLIHTIGSVNPPRDPHPWITKYIFPGGYTPSLSEVTTPIEKAGLIVSDIEVLKLHYSHTLRHWKENCDKNKDKIIQMFDEKFFRMWEFYLAGCEVLIGGLTFLKDWIIRSETSNALDKLYVRNISTGIEEELLFSDENIYVPGVSLVQRDRNTSDVYLGYSSPKTPSRVYLYNLQNKSKKLVKEQEIPSGHNPNDYIVERKEYKSHDGRLVPLTITRHKNTKIDGSANLLLYGYGSYGSSMSPSFSSTRLSLINRNIIWATAHIRGGMEKGMKWWKEGKLTNKKNTFEDYIYAAKYLIDKKYSSKGNIIGMGGSAGGLLMGAVVNQAPELFLGIIMAVPFVDSLTTNLDHSLPLTIGEFDEFGNAKDNKEHFDYIFSYAPYNNIKKMDYPHILITTSLSDNRVLFDEPAKFTAKLREYKTDNNLLLLKTEMNAGHGGKSGRDGAIEEITIDYAFALKISKKI
ncbi:class I SAM-dependent methyltransferase, partial [Candidatus Pelagibacter sp.]|nr:class I SAM-dependent methyltransferase [Candidatus Pelagibacter sp.]